MDNNYLNFKETINNVDIEEEMKKSFLDYSMSVIISRALPDVRDGLKPVHRRILTTLNDLNLYPGKSYRKCAKICGDVSGNYHPHGEAVVYPSLVRMAQFFTMRYTLVEGQGNFGSIDGDPPAAMRYTEARMTRLGQEMLRDLDKETVDFAPNYDGSRNEPVVLPSAFPNLLVNGAAGIAVGMAANIPPHNLGETIDALVEMIDNPEVELDGLLKKLPGPDFPTGGYICGSDGIISAYNTGRGSITLRAKAIVEKEKKGDKQSIIINEIPYQVNKTTLIEKIAELVRDKKISGIADLRDESDREGMRVVIELKRDAVPEVVLNWLYKHTPLQVNFGMILLAIVNNQPKVMSLKEALKYYLDHRFEVITRRCLYELRKAEERRHILEGFKIALDNLDEVIELIRASKDSAEAREGLMNNFGLTEAQAQAILELRLHRLTAMERQKILDELEQLIARIEELKEILADEKKIYAIVREELLEIKNRYNDERKTQIIAETTDLSIEDFIVEEDMVVTVTHRGYIKRNALSQYRAQKRGGKGRTGMTTRDEDFVADLFVASTHDNVLFFSNKGKVYRLKVHELPQAGRAAKGKAIINLLPMEAGEYIYELLAVRDFEPDWYIFTATQNGIVKKTELMAYKNIRAGGIIAMTIDKDDQLVGVRMTRGDGEVFLSSAKGKSVRFKEEAVRATGRPARGVKGMELDSDDYVVGMDILSRGKTILTASEHGFGKRTPVDEYRLQSRGGKGVITMRTTDRTGKVVSSLQVDDDDQVMLMTNRGKILRMNVKDTRTIGRATQGVKLIDLARDEQLIGMVKLAEREEETEEEKEAPASS